jgi:cell division protein FtsZ
VTSLGRPSLHRLSHRNCAPPSIKPRPPRSRPRLRRPVARRSRSGRCHPSRACLPSRSQLRRPPSPQCRRPSFRRNLNGRKIAPRMPSFEELPLPAQNEYRARRGQLPEAEHPERRRLTLLQRLAAVGLGRREDETDTRPDGRPVEAARAPERTPPRPAARHAEPRGPEPVSEFAKRGTPHGLDMHGRAAPLHPLSEDDQLDIPAFLRRQAN